MEKKINFPVINSMQVVLLRSDYNTGHVLDENYLLHISNNQKMYTIFNSLEDAKIFITYEQVKWKAVEFTIYDNNNNVIYESFIEK